jgi:hypothetical protein
MPEPDAGGEHRPMTSDLRTDPATDPPFLRTRSLWARGGAVVLALAWCLVVFAVGMFASVASPRGGWFYAALCFLPGLVGAGRLGGIRSWRDALLIAASLSLLLGSSMYAVAPPDHGRIRHVAEQVDLPALDWDLVDGQEYGNTWCFKGCPEVVYLYGADASPAEVAPDLDAHLRDQGWVGGPQEPRLGHEPSDYDPLARGSWSHGRWHITLTVPSDHDPSPWHEQATARGLTPVEVTFSAGG